MSHPTMNEASAGWYDDPHYPAQLRFWDGAQWTEQLAPKVQQPAPKRQRPSWLNRQFLAIAAVAAALLSGAYLAGVQSTQDEIRAAEDETASTRSDLKEARSSLNKTRTSLQEAEAILEDCDAETATEIFDDLMTGMRDFLNQYEDYLTNDETYFLMDLDSFDFGDYSGGNSMDDQFNAALEACVNDGRSA